MNDKEDWLKEAIDFIDTMSTEEFQEFITESEMKIGGDMVGYNNDTN